MIQEWDKHLSRCVVVCQLDCVLYFVLLDNSKSNRFLIIPQTFSFRITLHWISIKTRPRSAIILQYIGEISISIADMFAFLKYLSICTAILDVPVVTNAECIYPTQKLLYWINLILKVHVGVSRNKYVVYTVPDYYYYCYVKFRSIWVAIKYV